MYVWGGVLMPVKIVEVDTINTSSLILMENPTGSGKRTIVTANDVLALRQYLLSCEEDGRIFTRLINLF